MNQTRDGLECRRWDDESDLPGTGRRQQWGSELGSEAENYCRNPDEDSGGVWCYTNDPDDYWGYCDVPECEVEEGKLRSFKVKM